MMQQKISVPTLKNPESDDRIVTSQGLGETIHVFLLPGFDNQAVFKVFAVLREGVAHVSNSEAVAGYKISQFRFGHSCIAAKAHGTIDVNEQGYFFLYYTINGEGTQGEDCH
jgi:hypothetical protein